MEDKSRNAARKKARRQAEGRKSVGEGETKKWWGSPRLPSRSERPAYFLLVIGNCIAAIVEKNFDGQTSHRRRKTSERYDRRGREKVLKTTPYRQGLNQIPILA